MNGAEVKRNEKASRSMAAHGGMPLGLAFPCEGDGLAPFRQDGRLF